MKKLILLLIALTSSAFGQCGIAPTGLVYLDANGVPLSGGFIGTYASGTTTPATTYSDPLCSVPLPNPVPLNASGQPYPGTGGVSGVWLNTTLLYRFVLQNSSLVTQWTLDGITGTGTTSSSTTNYWTLSGTTISNNNAGGLGIVSVGGNFTSAGTVLASHGLILNDTQVTPNTVTIRAPQCEGTSTGGVCSGQSATWRWPSVDAAGVMTSDGMGNLSFQPGGGGGGSAVGPTGAVQLQAGGGAFTGSANLTYISQLLTATASSSSVAAIAAGVGFVQSDSGLYVTTGVNPSWQNINVPTGGVYAANLYGINYTTTGSSSGAPTPTTGQPSFSSTQGLGTVYCDTGSTPCVEKLWNGSAWVTLASGGATSPGGSNCDVQFNSAGSFGGSANFTYNCSATPQEVIVTAASSSSPGLAVGVGYLQADNGLLVTSGASPSWQNINVPTGGVYARSGYFNGYIVSGNSAGAPGSGGSSVALTAGQPVFSGTAGLGGLYCDTSTTPCVEKYWNGSAWIAWSSGGGGSCPGGSANGVQYNNSGVCGSSSTFTFNGTNLVGLTGTRQLNGGAGTGLNVTGNTAAGSIQTVGGFNANSLGTSGNAAFNVDGVAVIDQSRNITGQTIQAQVGVNVTNTAFNSIQTTGNIDACTGGSCSGGNAIAVAGTTVINSLGTFVGSGIVSSGGASLGGTLTVTGAAGVFNGGLTTASSTNSTLYIGTGGNLYIRTFTGGAPSCSGIATGWLGYNTSNNEMYICNGGTEYHSGAFTTP